MKTTTMKSSPFVKPFENKIMYFICNLFYNSHTLYYLFREWEMKLHTLNDIIELLVKVQLTWMYLESIFSSPDIQSQMPDESRKFNAVDKVNNIILKLKKKICFKTLCLRLIIVTII